MKNLQREPGSGNTGALQSGAPDEALTRQVKRATSLGSRDAPRRREKPSVAPKGRRQEPEALDLLYGMGPISTCLAVSKRQAYHLADKAGLPTFKLAGVVCARRSTLNAWLAEREAAALAARREG